MDHKPPDKPANPDAPTEEEMSAYEEAVRAFESRGEPEGVICFCWPRDSEWQLLGAFKEHESQIPVARQAVLEAREASNSAANSTEPITEEMLIGDALNGLAEMVRTRQETAFMGGLTLFITRSSNAKYMFAVIRREPNGSFVDAEPMPPSVTNLKTAREWCDAHPLIAIAKFELLLRGRKPVTDRK